MWVCGPPRMNETFDKTLEKAVKANMIPKNGFEIMWVRSFLKAFKVILDQFQ